MALIFQSNITKLYGGAILRSLWSVEHTLTPVATGLTVYGGVQPTAAQVAADWATYNSSSTDYLVHFTDCYWDNPTEQYITLSSPPTSQTPVRNGTATWAIMWNLNPTGPQLDSTTLPRPTFLVVPVSDILGTGVIRFSSTSFSTSTAITVSECSLNFTI